MAVLGTPSRSDFRLEETGCTAIDEEDVALSACDGFIRRAILCECLAGQPPFKAATALETLVLEVRSVRTEVPFTFANLMPAA